MVRPGDGSCRASVAGQHVPKGMDPPAGFLVLRGVCLPAYPIDRNSTQN